VGCSGTATGETGTNPNACQGICPVGWHIPTGGSDGEYQALHDTMTIANSCSSYDCWNASSAWEGVFGGYCPSGGSPNGGGGDNANYWSSTIFPPGKNSGHAYNLYFYSTGVYPGTGSYYKNTGFSVRCVKNY
jgi:uncharacterized protein (TIGR02145 family)